MHRDRPSMIGTITVVAAIAAVGGLAVAAQQYGGDLVWPGLAGNFVASLTAFVLALAWDRHRQREADERAAARATAEWERELEGEQARRDSEASQRLHAVRDELETNLVSIAELVRGFAAKVIPGQFVVRNPQLLDGAWRSSREPLGDLLTDYDLVNELHFFYGRLEELRWRLRYRTEARTDKLDGMIKALIDEMLGEVRELLSAVTAREAKPEVRPPSLVHERVLGGVVVTVPAGGAVAGGVPPTVLIGEPVDPLSK